MLMDREANELIFAGGFLAGFGVLDLSEREYLVKLHKKKMKTTFNPRKREMKHLKWFKVTDLRDAILVRLITLRKIRRRFLLRNLC